jgi:hypothetical protein
MGARRVYEIFPSKKNAAGWKAQAVLDYVDQAVLGWHGPGSCGAQNILIRSQSGSSSKWVVLFPLMG